MSPTIEPPNSVLLLVGREEFTPPPTFAGEACVATPDCIAVGVLSVDDGPTLASFAQAGEPSLATLGEFTIESEGHLSLRDVYNREYDSIGVDAGAVRVTVMGNNRSEPSEVRFIVGPRLDKRTHLPLSGRDGRVKACPGAMTGGPPSRA